MADNRKVVFELATERDTEECVRFFLDHYLKDETISETIGVVPTEEWEQFARPFISSHVAQKVTFIARQLDGDRAIVGYRGAVITTPAELMENISHIDPTAFVDPKLRLFTLLMKTVLLDEKTLASLRHSERLCAFQILNVRKDYLKRGIGTKLNRLSLQAARDQACDMVTVASSGKAAQSAFEKVGFETVWRTPYTDYTNDDGAPLVMPKNGTTHMVGYRIIF